MPIFLKNILAGAETLRVRMIGGVGTRRYLSVRGGFRADRAALRGDVERVRGDVSRATANTLKASRENA